MENLQRSGERARVAWVKETLRRAVDEIVEIGLFDEPLIEAKPVWIFPPGFVIGKVRVQGESREFIWMICGDLPLDYLKSTLAKTPREAARHFALKWQLDAARRRDLAPIDGADARKNLDAECERLASGAESLFKLIEVDSLWT